MAAQLTLALTLLKPHCPRACSAPTHVPASHADETPACAPMPRATHTPAMHPFRRTPETHPSDAVDPVTGEVGDLLPALPPPPEAACLALSLPLDAVRARANTQIRAKLAQLPSMMRTLGEQLASQHTATATAHDVRSREATHACEERPHERMHACGDEARAQADSSEPAWLEAEPERALLIPAAIGSGGGERRHAAGAPATSLSPYSAGDLPTARPSACPSAICCAAR